MEALEARKIRWSRLEPLFHRALEYPAAERTERARAWCGDDTQLLSELLDMIASDSSVEVSFASTPVRPSENFLQRERPWDPDADSWDQRLLGPWRVERMLGRGGMGVVYLAHRISGGFTQTVAIKRIARHLSSGPAVQQFHRERDALALLEHKNIARLLDAGVSPEGEPFVVMEYVEGRPFDEVLDDPALSLEAKLGLIQQLCDAVTYVHRNLILHRDLKPANVMVTGEGVVKLLDFGTLKLIGPAADLSSEMTQAGMKPMTLRYASPEHIAGRSVSALSDVYALGMILYRLLAGRLPESIEANSIAAYLERLEARQPVPPSQLSRVSPARNNLSLSDLDAIALKAIRFEPDQRYESADGLAADLQLCLEHRPVAARREGLRYRTTRFFERNRTASVATAGVLAILAIGLGLMLRQTQIAHADQKRAEAGIEVERKLAHLLLVDYFGQLQEIPGSTDAQKKAVAAAVSYLDGINRAQQNPQFQLESAQGYIKLGNLQGNPYQLNEGDPVGGLQSLDKAVRLATSLRTNAPNDRAVLLALALAQKSRSEVLFGSAKIQEALAAMHTAVEIYDGLTARPDATVIELSEAASACNSYGDQLGATGLNGVGDYAGALAVYRKGIGYSQRVLTLDPKFVRSKRSIMLLHTKLGGVLSARDPQAAIVQFHDALADYERFSAADRNSPKNRSSNAYTLYTLADVLRAALQFDQAIDFNHQARDVYATFVAKDPADTSNLYKYALMLSNEAGIYVDELDPVLNPDQKDRRHNTERAFDLYSQSIAIRTRLLAADPTNLRMAGELMTIQVYVPTLQQRLTPTPALAAAAASTLNALEAKASAPDATLLTLQDVTDILLLQPAPLRNPKMLLGYAQRLAELDHHQTPYFLLTLARAYSEDGQPDKAAAIAREGLALMPALKSGDLISGTRKWLQVLAHS